MRIKDRKSEIWFRNLTLFNDSVLIKSWSHVKLTWRAYHLTRMSDKLFVSLNWWFITDMNVRCDIYLSTCWIIIS